MNPIEELAALFANIPAGEEVGGKVVGRIHSADFIPELAHVMSTTATVLLKKPAQ